MARSTARPSSSKAAATRQKNEGEGNRTAAKAYNEATRKFVRAGKVPAAAAKAKGAVGTKESKAAEAKGLSRARH